MKDDAAAAGIDGAAVGGIGGAAAGGIGGAAVGRPGDWPTLVGCDLMSPTCAVPSVIV